MEQQKIRFRIEAFHRWTRGPVYEGLILEGFLLEGELAQLNSFCLPLKNGNLIKVLVDYLGVIQEGKFIGNPQYDGIPYSIHTDRVTAPSKRVHVGFHTWCRPDDVDVSRFSEGVSVVCQPG